MLEKHLAFYYRLVNVNYLIIEISKRKQEICRVQFNISWWMSYASAFNIKQAWQNIFFQKVICHLTSKGGALIFTIKITQSKTL